MKKALKITGISALGILVLFVLILLIIFIRHRILLKKEEALVNSPLGEMIEVDGHKMCVYTAGEGPHTLVFLAGSGIAAPILDFKSLYTQLDEDYRIVVIEKFGYGFSDVVEEERSFDTILAQDREALAKAGLEGPYILCPHSMSGLEAIMWAQNHPEEVEAIVGLDMVVPEFYDDFDFTGTIRYEKKAATARKMGLIRFYYNDSALPTDLSDEDKRIYKALAAKKAVNVDVINETLAIPEACEEINSKPKPDLPMLMFHSNGTGNLGQAPVNYAADLSNCSVIELDCGHNVHYTEYEQISLEMKKFFEDKLRIR